MYLVHALQHVSQDVVFHEGVLRLVCRGEGVPHHLLQTVLGDAAAAVGDPEGKKGIQIKILKKYGHICRVLLHIGLKWT